LALLRHQFKLGCQLGRLSATAMASLGFVIPASSSGAPFAGLALRGAGQAQPAAAHRPAVAGSPGVAGYLGALGSAALAAAVGARASQRRVPRGRRASVVPLQAAVGDAVPNIGLDKGFPPEKVMLADYCKGKKVVLVGLPGAFTPT